MLTNNTLYRHFPYCNVTQNLTQIKNFVFTVFTIVMCELKAPLFFQTEVNFGKDIADNSWHFVVFTVDPVDSNEVQFYLDGDLAGNPQ